MTIFALLRAVRAQISHGEGAVGLCTLFVGLIWGTLAGGLVAGEPVRQLLVAGVSMMIGAMTFVSREVVLPRAALEHAQS